MIIARPAPFKQRDFPFWIRTSFLNFDEDSHRPIRADKSINLILSRLSGIITLQISWQNIAVRVDIYGYLESSVLPDSVYTLFLKEQLIQSQVSFSLKLPKRVSNLQHPFSVENKTSSRRDSKNIHI